MLAPSDVLRYRLVHTVDGKSGSPQIRLVHGFELRGADGLYQPTDLAPGDLPLLIALRLPAAATAEWTLKLLRLGNTRVTAQIRRPAPDAPDTPTDVQWSLVHDGANGGAPTRGTGTAAATVRRREDGCVTRAEVSLRWERGETGAQLSPTLEAWSLELVDRRTCRHDRFAAEVDAAVDRGVAWLRRQQSEEGHFGPYHFDRVGSMQAGHSALCLYALLVCGVAPEDAQVRAGLAWLRRQELETTYEIALALLAAERAYGGASASRSGKPGLPRLSPDAADWVSRLTTRLEQLQGAPGAFGYLPADRAGSYSDASNTQFAALGLRAAARMGQPVNPAIWTALLAFLDAHGLSSLDPQPTPTLTRAGDPTSPQQGTVARPVPIPSCGYAYLPPTPGSTDPDRTPTASMTLAAIATFAIAREQLLQQRRPPKPALLAQIDARIRSAWTWLDRRWAVDRVAQLSVDGPGWLLYALWSLERAADLDSIRLVGGKDWYYDGGTEILELQNPDGSWPAGWSRASSTCFALLFFRRSAAVTVTRGG